MLVVDRVEFDLVEQIAQIRNSNAAVPPGFKQVATAVIKPLIPGTCARTLSARDRARPDRTRPESSAP